MPKLPAISAKAAIKALDQFGLGFIVRLEAISIVTASLYQPPPAVTRQDIEARCTRRQRLGRTLGYSLKKGWRNLNLRHSNFMLQNTKIDFLYYVIKCRKLKRGFK